MTTNRLAELVKSYEEIERQRIDKYMTRNYQ
jgi:hypothetical protein